VFLAKRKDRRVSIKFAVNFGKWDKEDDKNCKISPTPCEKKIDNVLPTK